MGPLLLIDGGEELPPALQRLDLPKADLGLKRGPARPILVWAALSRRAHWVERALEEGRHVFCPPPLATDLETLERLVNKARQRECHLLVASPLSCAQEFAALLREGPGPSLAFEWRLRYGRGRSENQGVLARAADYLGLIPAILGSVDAVWARSRSLVHGQRAEDWAVALLRLKNGTEGLVQVDAVGTREQVCLQVHGATGTWEYSSAAGEVDWEGLLAHFDAVLRGEEPWCTGAVCLQGMQLAHWIERSARLEREVYHKEVVFDR